MNNTVNHSRSVAIIMARGGSKRIPGKNIRDFCGKPILAYSIEAALDSGVFSEVMVSTDSDEIARIAEEYGAKVPFRRSEGTAGDYATTDEVIAEVLEKYDCLVPGKNFPGDGGESEIRLENHRDEVTEGDTREKAASNSHVFSRFCCIYPTAPFITPERLHEAMALLEKHESVLPVVKFSYPPQRGLVVSPDGRAARWMPQYENTRSQDLMPIYHDAGQFYACRTDAFFRGRTTDVEDMVPLVLPEAEVQDIDTLEDWAAAERKFHTLKGEAEQL